MVKIKVKHVSRHIFVYSCCWVHPVPTVSSCFCSTFFFFYQGSLWDSSAAGGLPCGQGPLTSFASRYVPPPSIPAGGWCRSLTDRYKVATMSSEVLISPLSLSCPGQWRSPPSARLTCLFVSLLNYRVKYLVSCTAEVIANVIFKKKAAMCSGEHDSIQQEQWSSEACEWYWHVASSLWGLKCPFVGVKLGLSFLKRMKRIVPTLD